MTPEVAEALKALGIAAAAMFTGWQAWQSRKVRATLTTNNGGSHAKDQWDRIEARQIAQDANIADLRTEFANHLTSGAADQADLSRRLDRLERRRLLPFL